MARNYNRLLVVFLFTLGINTSNAQFLEFGGGVGTSNYSGDLIRGIDILQSGYSVSGFARFNFSEFTTVRLGLSVGNLRGSETPIDAFATQRNHSFSSQIYELSTVAEYHFLNFKNRKNPINYSPYIFGGVGVFYFPSGSPEKSNIQPVIPFGAGFKYLFTHKYTLGFEVGARKTFYDYLDGISDNDQSIKDYQYGNPNDNDWYFFTGISLSITLFNIPCPFPYKPNKGIFSE